MTLSFTKSLIRWNLTEVMSIKPDFKNMKQKPMSSYFFLEVEDKLLS